MKWPPLAVPERQELRMRTPPRAQEELAAYSTDNNKHESAKE